MEKKVKEEDFFRDGMSGAEWKDALYRFVSACQENHQQVPLWARMQMDEEKIIPNAAKPVPGSDFAKAMEDIDREFGLID